MSLNLLKVIDIHKNENESVVEMLVTPDNDKLTSPDEEFNRAVWMRTSDIINQINQGSLCLTNMSMDIYGEFHQTKSNAMEMMDSARRYVESELQREIINIIRFVQVGFNLQGIVTYASNIEDVPEDLINELKQTYETYETRFRRKKDRKTLIEIMENIQRNPETVGLTRDSLFYVRTSDSYIIGSKENILPAISDILIIEIKNRRCNPCMSNLEVMQDLNITLADMLQSRQIEFNSTITAGEIREEIAEHLKRNGQTGRKTGRTFGTSNGATLTEDKSSLSGWLEHGDLNINRLQQAATTGARQITSGATRLGQGIKNQYDSIDKQKIKEDLIRSQQQLEKTQRQLNETLRKINADERTIEAKKSIKKGFINMFKRHTDE